MMMLVWCVYRWSVSNFEFMEKDQQKRKISSASPNNLKTFFPSISLPLERGNGGEKALRAGGGGPRRL
jgi:hypothetical protein